jgi:hypothetical protein
MEVHLQRGIPAPWLLALVTFAIVVPIGCSRHSPRVPVRTRPAPLRSIDTETEHLISKALSVAVDSGMGDCPERRCLVLNTVDVFRPEFSYESVTQAALPDSDRAAFMLVSKGDIARLLSESKRVQWIEISRVELSDDEATVYVSFWSSVGAGGGASGPILLFRRVDEDWAFVEVTMWHELN